MKKILLFVICAIMAVSVSGCMGSGGNSLEGVQTSEAPDASKVDVSKYKNNLDGLEKYFVALGYIPEKAQGTEMMYNVIGAVDGDRYNFTVNSSVVYVELYEYDTEHLNDEAKRVINEVKKDGLFYVFDNKNNDESNIAYEATLSDNGKYLMIYTDTSTDEANTTRKTDVINALKAFKK